MNVVLRFLVRRIIPARAGNADTLRTCTRVGTDHPRAGGERNAKAIETPTRVGSSPRGRGTHRCDQRIEAVNRIIPARAGNAVAQGGSPIKTADHPRAGGERSVCRSRQPSSSGSSPRGRGTLRDDVADARVLRVIPARAGNASPLRSSHRRLTDHPRAGGERVFPFNHANAHVGSSPRGRGTPKPAKFPRALSRIIPARAGNASRGGCQCCAYADHPRAGGERFSRRLGNVAHTTGSSPRGRGTRPVSARVCVRVGGSSPRGRGTPRTPRTLLHRLRIIPARAGNA